MLDACLQTYLCFFLLEKWFLSNLDTSWIPPRHLAICRALKDFSYRNLNRSSTVGGSNEKVPRPSIASRHLVAFSTTVSVDVVFLDTFLDRWLDTSWHLYLSRITKDLYILSSRSSSYFYWSLSRYLCLLTSQNTFSHSKPLPKWFSSFFKFSFTL